MDLSHIRIRYYDKNNIGISHLCDGKYKLIIVNKI